MRLAKPVSGAVSKAKAALAKEGPPKRERPASSSGKCSGVLSVLRRPANWWSHAGQAGLQKNRKAGACGQLLEAAAVRRIRSGPAVHPGKEKPEVLQQAQPVGRADRQMAARLVCYARVGAGHLPAAHLKRWAFHFMPKLKLKPACFRRQGSRRGGRARWSTQAMVGLHVVRKNRWRWPAGAEGAKPRRLRSAKATCQVVHAKAQAGCPSAGGQRNGEACMLVLGECSGCRKRRGGRSRSLHRLRRWPAGGGFPRLL